jgi:hypothetical protein
MILVRVLDLKFLHELAAQRRNFKSTALVTGTQIRRLLGGIRDPERRPA